jgi:FtsH-binding integral membrane protein
MAQASTLSAATEVRFNRFLALVYMIMSLGMVITAWAATSVSNNVELMKRILYNPWFAFGLFMLQIILVVALTAAVTRLSTGAALLMFLFYSALTGVSLSAIFIYYSQSTISYTFWLAAGMFFFSSLLGFFIKGEMSGVGRFLMLSLLGWLFGSIFLFAGLTVWDTNRLKAFSQQMDGQKGMGSMAVVGALALYLDFINLFLLLLRTSRR